MFLLIRGGGSGTVTVTADPNLSATARSTTLNFNSAGQVLKAVTANQMGMPYFHYPVFNYRLEQKTALDPCTGTVTATNFGKMIQVIQIFRWMQLLQGAMNRTARSMSERKFGFLIRC